MRVLGGGTMCYLCMVWNDRHLYVGMVSIWYVTVVYLYFLYIHIRCTGGD